jgi:hypothetical protein
VPSHIGVESASEEVLHLAEALPSSSIALRMAAGVRTADGDMARMVARQDRNAEAVSPVPITIALAWDIIEVSAIAVVMASTRSYSCFSS